MHCRAPNVHVPFPSRAPTLQRNPAYGQITASIDENGDIGYMELTETVSHRGSVDTTGTTTPMVMVTDDNTGTLTYDYITPEL